MTTLVTQPFIDWLTFNAMPHKMTSWMARFLRDDKAVPCRRAFHHEAAISYYPSGIRQYFSRLTHNKQSTWVIDGEAWNLMRSEHEPLFCLKMMRIIARRSVNWTRVDLAVDLFDKGYLAASMAKDCVKGILETGQRKSHVVMGGKVGDGCTTYIGSRSSPRMMRCYDKNVQSHGVVPTTRIEFELKGWASNRVQEVCTADFSLLKATHVYNGLLHEFLPGEYISELGDFFYRDVHIIKPPAIEPMLSKKQWLEKQVMPSLLGGWHTPEGELYQWFLARMKEKGRERSE